MPKKFRGNTLSRKILEYKRPIDVEQLAEIRHERREQYDLLKSMVGKLYVCKLSDIIVFRDDSITGEHVTHWISEGDIVYPYGTYLKRYRLNNPRWASEALKVDFGLKVICKNSHWMINKNWIVDPPTFEELPWKKP